MTMTRRKIDAPLKARIALEALRYAEPGSTAPTPICRSAGNARCSGWRARAFTASRVRLTTTTSRLCAASTRCSPHGRSPAPGVSRTLSVEGFPIDRKRVRRLMRRIEALGPKPRTSKPAPGHKIYPYLLRGLSIERSNQVWAADITYIPLPRGFLYLVAVIDWASRAVLSWRLSNTMDAWFCVAALEEALVKCGKPDIFNTDQGSQFTGAAFTGALIEAGCASRWMGAAAGWTTSSSSASGARSNTRTSISKATPTVARRKPASANTSPSTTSAAFIRRLAIARRWPSGATARCPGPMDMWTTQRVDHMPTVGSETAGDRNLGGLIKDNQQTVFQLSRRQKRSRFAGPLHSSRSEAHRQSLAIAASAPRARIRHSWTRCQTGAMNEAWRHLDRRRRQGLRGQAARSPSSMIWRP